MDKNIALDFVLRKKIVRKYLDNMKVDSNHRFKSWEHCYKAFGNQTKEDDELALHLAFYLASWGMYRGSCGIFWKDYKIHIKTIDTIRNFYNLRNKWYVSKDIIRIIELYKEIQGCCIKLKYYKADGTELDVSATDTLVTKIMLGTIGCVPAIDNLFKVGAGIYSNRSFDEKLMVQIIEFSEKNRDCIRQCQSLIQAELEYFYPPMKIVDMYFWQLGYDEFQKKKTKAAK